MMSTPEHEYKEKLYLKYLFTQDQIISLCIYRDFEVHIIDLLA